MELIGGILVVLLSILTMFYAYFKYSFQYWKSRGVPHDKPLIPYGNIRELRKTKQLGFLIKDWYDKYKPTGAKLCGAYFLAFPEAVILDLELVNRVLVKDSVDFDDRGLFYNEKDDPLSAHLFSLNGEKWRKLRAKLTPTFTSGKMKYMFPTIVEVGERFRDCLFEVISQSNEVEMRDLLARFTTDVIGTCAFGIDCNSLKDPNAEFRHYGRLILSKRRYKGFISILTREFQNFSRAIHLKSIHDDVSKFFMKAIHDTVEYREKNNVNRNDFMDLLIKLKNEEKTDKAKAITFNELAAQCYVFFLGGFETSSATLTYCLYELALNTDIQSKARRVIEDAYQKYDGHFTYEMMMDMPYIDQILEETLRKYPLIPILNRRAKKDYPVEGSNIVIEKGTRIIIPIYGIHHDPEYYPNPEAFDPDRFGVDEKKKRHAMTWLPFGEGPRICIGNRFGMMQARVALVILLNNFELDVSLKSIPLVVDVNPSVLFPKDGVYLKLKPIIKM